jgi:hypothetical protein
MGEHNLLPSITWLFVFANLSHWWFKGTLLFSWWWFVPIIALEIMVLGATLAIAKSALERKKKNRW